MICPRASQNEGKNITSSSHSITLHSSSSRELTANSGAGASVPSAHLSPANPSSDTINTHLQIRRTHRSLKQVLLSTALIEVRNCHDVYERAIALLDNGSERSFISEPFCKLLGVKILQSTHEIRGVGNSVTQCNQTCDIEIKSRVKPYTTKLQCFVLKQISSMLPAVHYERAKFRIPHSLQLADPHFLNSRKIDILIGADIFWELLNEGNIRLPNGPYLQNTHLGWIISGSIIFQSRNDSTIQCNLSQSIDTQLRQFWEVEELPRDRDTRTDAERACEELFSQTTKRNDEGRFIVKIPLKASPELLGESYFHAERRFLSLEKRLQREPALKQLYADFLHEYESLGHMTRISSYGSSHYFLPHSGVLRDSSTTRLRVVFDASAATSTGLSFNAIQLVGPPIQGDLISILLRFRQHKYVACADIEKMYRQCLVDEAQRDLQLILWRDDPTQALGVYRLNTVTYGTASAPFLSVRCLKQLAIESTNDEVRRIINEDFYVDDLITGSDEKQKLIKLCIETSATLQSGCFPLRKWILNFSRDESSEHLTSVSAHTSKQLDFSDNSSHKTLGVGWLNDTDEFYFNTQFEFHIDQPITKRSILSYASQIFDPLGMLSPFIVTAKMLLQQLWLLKLGWDDVVPSDVARQWNRFIASLSILQTIRIPRYVMDSNAIHTELHIFTDASQTAYGACAYIRTLNFNNHTANVRLLCSKGKVAPLKTISIPRLELLGALIGARLYDKIKKSIQFQFDNIMFWTDSTIVLGWLRMQPRLLKTFVHNRTTEIHELTKELPWRHVSGKDNPADLVSRGVLNLSDLSSSHLWWEGPAFLHDVDFNCINVPPFYTQYDTGDLPDLKNSDVTALTSHMSEFEDGFINFERFSQFSRLRHATAYVLRFIHNTRNKFSKRSGVLSVDELRESDKLLTRLSQLESFPVEYKSIVNKNALKNKHNLSKLSLFIDNDRILRVGGRLDYSSEFDYDKKHPVLLSGKHRFTLLLFRHAHKILLHAAPQALLCHIRESWWPLAGRNLARKVFHDCVVCKRIKGRTLTPLMGNLPSERITPTFPFYRCGVDYGGPISILNRKGKGAKTTKAYICIFICFATRAVHLELVSDLTAKAYLLALSRLISRRSKPDEIWSDNARTFLGLKNEFADFLERCGDEIIEHASQQNIKFKFIVPYAPHFGGLWEAGVRSCKYHLRRVVGNANLTYEEYSTVLAQIEAVLNSRPLSPISSHPNDLLPLTPAHFLVGRPLTAPACDSLVDAPVHRLDRYQRVEQIRQHFWTRWSKEYVSELQTRVKWRETIQDLKPDTMVIIKEDNFPPLKWHLGRVVRSIPGKDGVARVAEIRTSSGLVRRAYTKICPLVDPDEAL
ncbi:uncharacterized protein LOC112051537 [Bicyclus anynana]|uniref:Uncharacterized protein LOC112051537 n=1 Tax=Bicyclus anynana TaxID=110368 RepID=A0ABM3M5M7_BICAN|nr:uncharacterized protein LOC112051537 [Bicyclus anynana]